MKTALTLLLASTLYFLMSCSDGSDDPNDPIPEEINDLKDVRFWAYQIQKQDWDDNLDLLANSHYDLLVIDQTRSLIGDETYDSKSDIEYLKNSENSVGGKKFVVCYIDVGEAESYRYYWQDGWTVGDPEWIAGPDPDGWDENYPVKFWRDEWKTIMKDYLGRIMDDGYDGIYLDWLEVYDFDPVEQAAADEGLDVIEELTDFIAELRAYADSRNPDFWFIAQNASELCDYPEYVALFDAISQEQIWYDGGGDPDSGEQPGDVPLDPYDSDEYVTNLKKWLGAGKVVFNCEYARETANVERSYRLGKENGFKTYVTLRLLDELTKTPPPGY